MQTKFGRLLIFGMVLYFLILCAGIGSADEVNVELVTHYGGRIVDVAVLGNNAYVTGNSNGFNILDISNSSGPKLLGNCTIYASSLTVSGSYAYLSGGDFSIVDISNFSSPKIAGICDTTDAKDVAISGNYAYVADGSKGLTIVNITSPSSPQIVGNYDTDGYAYDIAVLGNYAYISDGWDNLIVLDITDPISPTLCSNYYTSAGFATNIAIVNNYIYVISYDEFDDHGYLEILDISNPYELKVIGSCRIAGYSYDIAIHGNYSYISLCEDRYIGVIQIINISNPSAPKIAGKYYPEFGYTYGIAVSDEYVYAATGSLLILKTDVAIQDTTPELTAIGNKTINETELLIFAVSATDSDGDTITYSATDLPSGATVNSTTGLFNWIPGTGTAGVYNVTFTATANGQSDSETIKITVLASDWNPWNDPGSENGEKIALSELQAAIYDWRYGITLPNGEKVDLTRLQGLIYSWRFGS